MDDSKVRFRAPRNRKTKRHIVFDEKSRADFITGFKQRKEQRRAKGREKLEKMLKDKKKEFRQQKRDDLKAKIAHVHLPFPEPQLWEEVESFELPAQSVTIAQFKLPTSEPLAQEHESNDEEDQSEKDAQKSRREALKKKAEMKAKKAAQKKKAAVMGKKAKKKGPTRRQKMKKKRKGKGDGGRQFE